MQDLSLHILDIAENSITAGADRISIIITESSSENILKIEIHDNGKGMDSETLKKASDPFFSTKEVRGNIGLGIPLLHQITEESNGELEIKTEEGAGTSVTFTFQHDHIDRKPLGDIASTITTLIFCHPMLNFIYEHDINGETFTLDTEEIREELGEIPLNSPDVIKYIKDSISSWLYNV
jgi:anti-sigma regulatory factor (Ser/Thr protein kinase)